jgi:hypothetical protein
VYRARLHAARGDLAAAARSAEGSRSLAVSLGLRLDEGIALRVLAEIHARAGDDALARARLDEAVRCLAGVDGYELARCEAARSRIARRRGDDAGATAARSVATDALARLGAARELAVLDDLDQVR